MGKSTINGSFYIFYKANMTTAAPQPDSFWKKWHQRSPRTPPGDPEIPQTQNQGLEKWCGYKGQTKGAPRWGVPKRGKTCKHLGQVQFLEG